MDGLITRCYQWNLSDRKEVKLTTIRRPRVTFQWKKRNGQKRGVSISEEAFTHLSSLTNIPQNGCDYDAVKRFELDSQVSLCCYGDDVKLTRYYTSRDNKKIDGSFIIFNGEEWSKLLQLIPKIREELEK